MRTFAILDGRRRKRRPCAYLIYDEGADEYGIVIDGDVSARDVPLMLAAFVERGQRRVGDKWSRRWVEERVVPTSRQNLGQILRANGLDRYDPIELLVLGNGRCSQDDFYIEEVESPAAIEGRRDVATLPAKVGDAIARARKDAGLTQVQLAARIGMTQSHLSNLERGKGNPTIAMLQDIATALDKEVEVDFT